VTVSYLQSSKKGETGQDDIPGDQLSEDFDFCRYDTVPSVPPWLMLSVTRNLLAAASQSMPSGKIFPI
jgi:hypothetical protein